MIKIEAITLEEAYSTAALKLECSVTELTIEVVQSPSSGFLGLFKKKAIIVAAISQTEVATQNKKVEKVNFEKPAEVKKTTEIEQKKKSQEKPVQKKKEVKAKTPKPAKKKEEKTVFQNTIMPESFVSTQDDEDYNMDDINFTADYDDEEDIQESISDTKNAKEVAKEIETEINKLFNLTCFSIDKIEVTAYDADTLLVEFKGEDAALLIGKEGYRYKALSYMIFNWINTKYKLQLRLEIAEFLKNQEESVTRYLVGVCENVDRDGRAQTKILDGVLVQIALKELREKYPNKYVAIRSTRDGLKFIIVNDYHN